MKLDWLIEPVSDEAPCGPDLEANDDPAFIDYYFEAESRMPERYFVPGIEAEGSEVVPGTLFDPDSIDIREERKKIEALLKRSRDLRLLSLLARFEILSGSLEGFRDAVCGAADLLEAFPAEAHPTLENGTGDRRAALEELGNNVTVAIPLQYVDIAGLGDTTYRRYLVGSGKTRPREGEEGVNAASIISAIGSSSSRDHVDRVHERLNDCAAALDRIRRACLGNEDKPFTPGLATSVEQIAEIQGLIASARSDLTVWSADGAKAAGGAAGGGTIAEAAAVDGAAPAAQAGADAAPSGAAPAPLPSGSTSIASQAAARRALEACEAYFAANEPSSAALLLVTQARLLIGKSLIEAFETLLPADAGRAKIDFGPDTGFVLPMDRLRQLAGEARRGEAPAEPAAEQDAPGIEVATRGDVAMAIRGVEDFFRKNEPASPIPVLLFKARDYLEKDFHAIVAALIPKAPPQG